MVHKERNLFGRETTARPGVCGDACAWPRAPWQTARPWPNFGAFLATRNAAAAASLDEAGEALITLTCSMCRPRRSPTNAIENVMRNYRGQTSKVTRWRSETDQISRWSATALLHVETGFHRSKGHADRLA